MAMSRQQKLEKSYVAFSRPMVQEIDVKRLLASLGQPEGMTQLLWKKMEEDYEAMLQKNNWINPGIIGVPSAIALNVMNETMGVTLEGIKKAIDVRKDGR